jgi:PAS domain-containing protein
MTKAARSVRARVAPLLAACESHVVPLIYEAAASGEPAWRAPLEALVKCVGVACAGVTFCDATGLRQWWAPRGPWGQAAGALGHRGSREPDGAAVTRREGHPGLVLAAPLWGDPSPEGPWELVAGMVETAAGRWVRLGLVLAPDTGPSRPVAAAVLRFLMPHVERAEGQRRRADAAAGVWQLAMEDALERVPVAAALVTQEGRLVQTNRAAEAALRVPGVVRAKRDGTLHLADPDQDGAFQQALRRGVAWQAVVVEASRGTRSVVSVVPLMRGRPRGVEPGAGPAALLYVMDPWAALPCNDRVLREAYGLTGAEARLCALVAQGMGRIRPVNRVHC